MSVVGASSGVQDRASEDRATLTYTEDNTMLVRLGDGDPHVLETSGAEAVDCSCKHREFNDTPCSHMVAYEDWEIDEVVLPHTTVEL